MPGPYLDKRYFDRIRREENRPARSAPEGGRVGCFGFDSTSAYPGEYHPKNCNGYTNRGGHRYNE